jgi:hypothetical protein
MEISAKESANVERLIHDLAEMVLLATSKQDASPDYTNMPEPRDESVLWWFCFCLVFFHWLISWALYNEPTLSKPEF